MKQEFLREGTRFPVLTASIIVAIAYAGLSLAGILFPGTIYPNAEMLRVFLPNDTVNMLIGVPFLGIAILLAWRHSVRGTLFLPGALLFASYSYVPYVLWGGTGPMFLPRLAFLAMSVYALLYVLFTMDTKAIQSCFGEKAPVKTSGGILAGIALFSLARQIGMMVTSAASGIQAPSADWGSWIADFLFMPALVMAGICLFRRKQFGFAVAPGFLFAFGLLSASLIPFLALQGTIDGTAPDMATFIVVGTMGLICLVPACVILLRLQTKR